MTKPVANQICGFDRCHWDAPMLNWTIVGGVAPFDLNPTACRIPFSVWNHVAHEMDVAVDDPIRCEVIWLLRNRLY